MGTKLNPLFVLLSHNLWDVSDHFVHLNPHMSCRQENVLLCCVANSFSCRPVFDHVTNKDVENKIKNVANKYLDQALDSVASDLFKRIAPTGDAIDIRQAVGKFPAKG